MKKLRPAQKKPKKVRRFIWNGDVEYFSSQDEIENPDWLVGSN